MLKENLKEECKTIKQVVSDAFKKWRTNYANLSQQNIHDFCKAYDIPVYNSQIAYLERGNLDAGRLSWLFEREVKALDADSFDIESYEAILILDLDIIRVKFPEAFEVE